MVTTLLVYGIDEINYKNKLLNKIPPKQTSENFNFQNKNKRLRVGA